MAYVTPDTRSPGRLILLYELRGFAKTAGVHLLDGKMPTGNAAALALASSFADVFKATLGNDQPVQGFKYVDGDGDELFSGLFNPIKMGTANGGAGQYVSASRCITGRGIAAAPGNRRGQTRLFFYNGIQVEPRLRRMSPGAVPGAEALITYLTDSQDLFADFYGQKATPKGYVTVQFNAHIQRTQGA